jgi:cobalamin biosynthesis Mg chelatase CobN
MQAAMRLQTDRKIEILRLVRTGEGTYAEARDPEDPTRNASAIDEGREFAPEIAVAAGDLLLVKVLE